MSSLRSSEISPRARVREDERHPLNGARSLGLGEALLGRRRPWWREGRAVRFVVCTALVAVALAYVTVVWSGVRAPLALVLELVAVWLATLVISAGRPCDRCGRWARHALTCGARR